MNKKEAKDVLRAIRKMGDTSITSKKDIEADRKRLKKILEGKQPLGLH